MPRTANLVFKPAPTKRHSEKPFAVLDIEAKAAFPGEPINTCFLGGGFYDGAHYYRFDSLEKLLEHCLDDTYHGWTIYAHNGSGYDFIFLLEQIVKEDQRFSAYRTGGRFFLTVEGRDFVDSMCVLRGSLRTIAQNLGVRTQKWDNLPDDFYQNIERYDWQPYLKDDCLCLYECVQSLRESMKLLGAHLKPTLASTALDLFQRCYLKSPISSLPWDHPSEEYTRASYVGGRTEVFKEWVSQGASWDINSSYPYAMLAHMPTELQREGCGNVIPEYGIVYATIDIPGDTHLPPLHYRAQNKLFFPTGRLQGWYTSLEARHCANLYGSKSVKVERYLQYRHAPIFKTYVETLYKARQEAKASGNASLAEAAKGLMNSLYGKTGMIRARQKIVQGIEYYSYPWNDPKALREIRRHGGMNALENSTQLVCEYSRDHYIYGIPVYVDYAPYIMPQIASWITADGRCRLHQLLEQAGNNAAYCDTDSVYVETQAPDALYKAESGAALGQLKREAQFAWAHFAAPKVYLKATIPDGMPLHQAFGNITLVGAAKGLPRKSLSSIQDYIDGKKVWIKRMTGALEILRREKTFRVESKEVSKQQKEKHGKRHPSGRPWTVTEIDSKVTT